MLKTTSVLCVLSILLCFNLNYTFPYNRGISSKWNIFRGNQLNYCPKSDTVDRTKKMASLTENTLKIMESTTRTTVPASNLRSKTNINRKSARKEEDLTHYEEMVIMKKNPYLDLKELEQKLYNPGWKRARASVAAAGDVAVGVCEERGPYVEVVNRGLSGFAIPTKLMKAPEPSAPPSSEPAAVAADDDDAKMTEHEHQLLTNLVKDIKKFEDSKILVK